MLRAGWIGVLVTGTIAACSSPDHYVVASAHAPSATAHADPPAVQTVEIQAAAELGAPQVGDEKSRVHIAALTDKSNRIPSEVRERVTRSVRNRIERTGYAIGGSPGFVVSPSVTSVEHTRSKIACKVTVRVAPVTEQGTELWEAQRMAVATGGAVAMTGRRADQISRALEDCVTAATEEVLNRRVLPFLAAMIAP